MKHAILASTDDTNKVLKWFDENLDKSKVESIEKQGSIVVAYMKDREYRDKVLRKAVHYFRATQYDIE